MEIEKVKEIKKALECCANWNGQSSCNDCPIGIEKCYKDGNLMQRLALTLINELESENERLKHLREVDNKTMTTLRQVNTELNECMDEMQDRIAELEEYIKGNEQDAKAFVNGWHKDLETELKQFAERLKEKIQNCSGCYIPDCFESPTNEFAYSEIEVNKAIDETLKEFVDKGNKTK